jgi:zinc/manganese transport system permease protein
MSNILASMFQYEFMRHAFIAGSVAALLSGIVGYFVIVRNLSFAAHALGHIGFAGASGALLINLSPMSGQLFLTLLAAIGIGTLGDRISKNDMVIGIILSFCLGLGTLFLHLYGGYGGQAMIILFGNLFGVTSHDLMVMFWLTLVCLIVIVIIAKQLLFASIEPELARAKSVPIFWLSIIFVCMMATAVTLASQVVGVILVFTLLIGPAAVAIQWAEQFSTGIALSVLLALLTVWIGLLLSYFTDWPISFCVSALVFVMYLISVGWKAQ